MPGFKIMLQDDKGEYPHTGRALIFEGAVGTRMRDVRNPDNA